MLIPGKYQQHYHIPAIGTALLPQCAKIAKKGQNPAPGLIYFFLRAVKGPFIITTPGIFGVAIATEGKGPKKCPKTTLHGKKIFQARKRDIDQTTANGRISRCLSHALTLLEATRAHCSDLPLRFG
jgi:hypothetical protein